MCGNRNKIAIFALRTTLNEVVMSELLNMRREEYLSRRAKKDFIRYAMLQKPRYTEHEIEEKLKACIDTESIHKKLKETIDTVVEKHLSEERLKDENGDTVTVLPGWLCPELIEVIQEEYRGIICNEFVDRSYIGRILQEIEKLTWAQGVDDMADNLKAFVDHLKSECIQLADMPRKLRKDYGLEEKYEAAKRITLRERITGSNDDDILGFRRALERYAKDECEEEMRTQLSKLYSDLAFSPNLSHIISWYGIARQEAEAELHRLELMPIEREWEEEYSRLVPMDFFRRNLAGIDESMAFRMILLQAFARHEDYLKSQNMLRHNGGLQLFTSPHFLSNRWSDLDFTIILS